jgi:hypothetical protein
MGLGVGCMPTRGEILGGVVMTTRQSCCDCFRRLLSCTFLNPYKRSHRRAWRHGRGMISYPQTPWKCYAEITFPQYLLMESARSREPARWAGRCLVQSSRPPSLRRSRVGLRNLARPIQQPT